MTYETLIGRLTERWGMGWGAISKAADLPVSRLRAWSRDDAEIPGEAIIKLELLDAWLSQAADVGSPEPAYELDRKLVDGYTATGWDLYCNDEHEALLRIAAGDDPATVLDDAFADWRTRFDTAWEVFDADDEMPAIRLKSGYRAPRSY